MQGSTSSNDAIHNAAEHGTAQEALEAWKQVNLFQMQSAVASDEMFAWLCNLALPFSSTG